LGNEVGYGIVTKRQKCATSGKTIGIISIEIIETFQEEYSTGKNS
jgi:hypothetical protein